MAKQLNAWLIKPDSLNMDKIFAIWKKIHKNKNLPSHLPVAALRARR
jgi:hypothetical protein